MTKPARAPSSQKSAKKSASRAGTSSIRRVLVLADGEKGEVNGLVAKLEPWLRARVESLEIAADVRAFYKERQSSTGAVHLRERPDLVVVLGGDGAILAAVRAFAETPVPTIGINFGRVGFLASSETSRWREALSEILENRAVVEPRMRLQAELRTSGSKEDPARKAGVIRAVALNDVVVTRGAYQGMLTLALKVGADWVTNYRADGLIVATPSGSTAYSMAAGGPILAPSMHAVAVTPICPQALSHRAIVLDASEELLLTVSEASGLTTLVIDGQGFYPMHQGDSVKLTRHPATYPLLALQGFDPYKRLRERLGWRGSFEPDVFPGDPTGPKRDDEDGVD
jgi:NAD+ kinase